MHTITYEFTLLLVVSYKSTSRTIVSLSIGTTKIKWLLFYMQVTGSSHPQGHLSDNCSYSIVARDAQWLIPLRVVMTLMQLTTFVRIHSPYITTLCYYSLLASEPKSTTMPIIGCHMMHDAWLRLMVWYSKTLKNHGDWMKCNIIGESGSYVIMYSRRNPMHQPVLVASSDSMWRLSEHKYFFLLF